MLTAQTEAPEVQRLGRGLRPFAGWPRLRALVVDPPWNFRDKLPGGGRGASKHYSLMRGGSLQLMDLPPMAEASWLFLWRVSAMQEEALELARAWGFLPKSEIVWVKTTASGEPACGMGHYVRGSHETCLIAVRGKGASGLRQHLSQRSVFMAPRGAHSEKPAEFYTIVENLVRGPHGELFARRRRPGWYQAGDELEAA